MKPNILFLCVIITIVHGQTQLSDSIHHFEPLSYNPQIIHHQHLRHKRSLPKENHEVFVDFSALGRQFVLRLTRDLSIFHNDFHLVRGNNQTQHQIEAYHYDGYVQGEHQSHVFGSIREGIFDGTISIPRDGHFYVERAQNYFPLDQVNSSMHSVIYHEKHVADPHGSFKAPGCGVENHILAWMEQVQSSHSEEQVQSSHSEEQVQSSHSEEQEQSSQSAKQMQRSLSAKQEKSSHSAGQVQSQNQTSKSSQSTTQTLPHKPTLSQANPLHKYTSQANRVKRETSNSKNKLKKTCTFYIQTDIELWRHFKRQEQTDRKTDDAILSLIGNHVKAVNGIYKNTNFGDDQDGYNFVVQRIKIDRESDCGVDAKQSSNKFCSSNIDVSNFLDHHSRTDHSSFCLAYVFTYRDFAGGTLGLAWVAKPTSSGGICETYKRSYAEHGNAMRSLNTGIITFVNYAAKVSLKVSQLTFAHEIGHNFGSPHDFPSTCRPGGDEGNYIMFPSATPGYLDHNSQFSDCSKRNISSVLDSIIKETTSRKNCFKPSEGAFCGNKIVEEGEECDCGYNEDECTEQCCSPRLINNELSDQRCKFKPQNKFGKKVACSPSEGPCCTENCTFIEKENKMICSEVDDCKEQSRCNGEEAKCPKQSFVPDCNANRPDDCQVCNKEAQVCNKGACNTSVCIKYGLEKCWVTTNDEDVVGKDLGEQARLLCYLACQKPNKPTTCKTAEKWAMDRHYAGLNKSLKLQPGMECDNYNGYCDVLQKCRRVDDDGPFARLKNLLFDRKSWATWMKTYWYAVIGLGVCFFVMMGLFIKCCAVHTPSSNPNMPKHVKIGTTLRRPMDTISRMDTLNRRGRSHARSSQPYSL